MARTATGYTFSDIPDATTSAAFRASLAANLTYWTVGPLYNLGTTNTYDAFTLTHNTTGAEILILFPTSQYVNHTHMIYTDFRDAQLTGADSYEMFISFAPEGGFEATLLSGYEPVNLDFWDNFATLELANPSKCMRGRCIYWNSLSVDIVYIEDDTTDMFCIYAYRTASVSSYYADMWLMGTTLITEQFGETAFTTSLALRKSGNSSGFPKSTGDYDITYAFESAAPHPSRQCTEDFPARYNAAADTTLGTQSSFNTAQFVAASAVVRCGLRNTGDDLYQTVGRIDHDVMLGLPAAQNQITPIGATASKKYMQFIDKVLSPWTNTLGTPPA